MKNKSVETEIQQTFDCVEKIKTVKPSSSYFDKIKEKLDLLDAKEEV
ncbi:MAG: hypothetical protein AB8G86_06740 [Saprospiraceae bacterium]